MKQKKVRLLGLLLAAIMLFSCLPMQALAAEGGWFYLAADWNGTLLIAPERVSYTADQTIFEALNASGHSFGPVSPRRRSWMARHWDRSCAPTPGGSRV